MDRSLPKAVNVDQGIPRKIQLEVPPFMRVEQKEFPPILEVSIHGLDDGMAYIGQAIQDDPLDLGEFPVLDRPGLLVFIFCINEELLPPAEIFRQKSVYES
jgi:hypothetical protein